MIRSHHRLPLTHQGLVAIAAVTLAAATAACSSSPSKALSRISRNQIIITATDHGYAVSGSLRPGTATITFGDHATVTHQMNAIRLKPGVTQAQVLTALSKGGDPDTDVAPLVAEPPGPANDYGFPSMAGPSQSITATVTDLPSGSYVLADFLAGPDGKPYVTKGFIGEFQVKGAPVERTPSIAGIIGLGDTTISFPAGFDGAGTYKLTNTTNHENSFALVRLDSAKGLMSYFQYVSARLNRQPIDGGGGTIAGTITNLRSGQSCYLTFRLTPGTYGYLEPPMGPPSGPPPSGTVTIR